MTLVHQSPFLCNHGVTPSRASTCGPPYTRLRGLKSGPPIVVVKGPLAPKRTTWGPHGADSNEKAQGALGPPIKLRSGNFVWDAHGNIDPIIETRNTFIGSAENVNDIMNAKGSWQR
jgi:hypothetical protein